MVCRCWRLLSELVRGVVVGSMKKMKKEEDGEDDNEDQLPELRHVPKKLPRAAGARVLCCVVLE